MAIEKTAEKQVFIPPREIKSARLVIRPFDNPEEEIEHRDIVQEKQKQSFYSKQHLGYYSNYHSPYIVYAGFLSDNGQFIGTVSLKFSILTGVSTHERFICENFRDKKLGTELLDSVLVNVVKPSIGHKVFVADNCWHSTTLRVIESEVRGHIATTKIDNYPSFFSNIKVGMCVNSILYHTILMSYPSKSDALDANLITTVFSRMSTYEKNISAGDESLDTILSNILCQSTLRDAILKIDEPYTVISIACKLFAISNNNGIMDELRPKIQSSYQRTLVKSEPDQSVIYDKARDLNVDADIAQDPLYKFLQCSGDIITTDDIDLV